MKRPPEATASVQESGAENRAKYQEAGLGSEKDKKENNKEVTAVTHKKSMKKQAKKHNNKCLEVKQKESLAVKPNKQKKAQRKVTGKTPEKLKRSLEPPRKSVKERLGKAPSLHSAPVSSEKSDSESSSGK